MSQSVVVVRAPGQGLETLAAASRFAGGLELPVLDREVDFMGLFAKGGLTHEFITSLLPTRSDYLVIDPAMGWIAGYVLGTLAANVKFPVVCGFEHGEITPLFKTIGKGFSPPDYKL